MNRFDTISKRFWAGVIDGFVFIPLGIFEGWLYSERRAIAVYIAWLIFRLSSDWLYSVLLHSFFGQTLGKMATGIKVLSVNETPISFRQAFMRDIVLIVLDIAILIYAIYTLLMGVPENTFIDNWFTFVGLGWFVAEVVTAVTNPQRRAIHDYIADTVVVRLDRMRLAST